MTNKKKEVLTPPQHSATAPPLLVDRTDARYYLGGICLKTLQTLIKDKKLPIVKVRGRTMIPYWAVVKLAKHGAPNASDRG
jgi:hypothetical protein